MGVAKAYGIVTVAVLGIALVVNPEAVPALAGAAFGLYMLGSATWNVGKNLREDVSRAMAGPDDEDTDY